MAKQVIVTQKLRSKIESELDALFTEQPTSWGRDKTQRFAYSDMPEDVREIARSIASSSAFAPATSVTTALMVLTTLNMEPGILSPEDASDLTQGVTADRHADLNTYLKAERLNDYQLSFHEFCANLVELSVIRTRYTAYIGDDSDLSYAFSLRADSLEEAEEAANAQLVDSSNKNQSWFNAKLNSVHNLFG